MISKKRCISFLTLLVLSIVLAGPVLAQETGKININTATKEEVVKLKGIGPKYAETIIAYRDANGPFETPEAIMQVKGIGKKIYETNKEVIAVE